jgi:predicted enzyme related to lactoylglutathione lyase
MVCRISHTTIDCQDAYALSTWWKDVVGYIDVPNDPNEPGDEECMNLDLAPTNATRDEEVERLRARGAGHVADRRRPDGTGWVVMTDPEGNEFCVLRSDAE